MLGTRKSAVSGMFYVDDKEQLIEEINEYLRQATINDKFNDVLGVISPHAGYVYSGLCAAYSFNALKQKDFDYALVIAPCHQSTGFYFSIGNYSSYRTPIGDVEVDRHYVKKFLEKDYFTFEHSAHYREHSLEIQLPFIQVINPKAKLIPIVISQQHAKNSLYLAKTIKEIMGDDLKRTAVIASSDLSHFHPGKVAEKMDSYIAQAVESLSPNMLQHGIDDMACDACGSGSILTLMFLAELMGYDNVKNLKYMHSGMINHDNSRVVGYLSSVFYR